MQVFFQYFFIFINPTHGNVTRIHIQKNMKKILEGAFYFPMFISCICTFYAPDKLKSHAKPQFSKCIHYHIYNTRTQIWMVLIFLWNTHSILTSKWIRHTYCIIHIHVVNMFQMLHCVHMIHTLHMFQLVHIVHMLCMVHMVGIVPLVCMLHMLCTSAYDTYVLVGTYDRYLTYIRYILFTCCIWCIRDM